MIRLGPALLAGDIEEEGYIIGLEILPRKRVDAKYMVLVTYLAFQHWGLTLGR